MMGSTGKFLWWALLVIAVGSVALVVFNRPGDTDVSNQEIPAAAGNTGRVSFLMEQQWLIRMKLAQAEQARRAPQLQSLGRVAAVPSKRAIVSPPVGGIVQTESMPVIGQRVRQGQILASILQTPSAAEAAQIQMENIRLEAERRRLAQTEVEARARLEEASHDLARSQRLFEKRAYSAKALEADELARTAAAAQLEAIREQLKALQTGAAGENTYEVRAPISGAVIQVNKSRGEQVAAGDAILEIAALDTVWVEAPVLENDLGKLRSDARAVFTTAAFPGRSYEGRIVHIGRVVDPQTRTAMVILEASNSNEELRIGMQANVRLDAGPLNDVLLIPKEAVLDNEGKKIVYVLISGEEFERREVTLGEEYGDRVAVLSGVTAGERVVTQGAYQLKLQELRPADPGAHTHEV